MNSHGRKPLLARHHGFVFSRLFSLALTVGLLTFNTQAFAEHIKVAYAALSAGQIALWIAKEGGYLSNYGIDADVIYVPQVAATQALIAGEIQLAQVTGVSTAGAILGGADVRIVASSLNRLVGFIYARPEIKSPEQLKDKKIGISRFGALSDTAVGIFLERFGLKRGTDVAIIQLGGLPEIVTAMERGAIHAGFGSPPNSSRAKRLGMRELFDIDALALELQQTCITTTSRYIRERRRQILCPGLRRRPAPFRERSRFFHPRHSKIYASE